MLVTHNLKGKLELGLCRLFILRSADYLSLKLTTKKPFAWRKNERQNEKTLRKILTYRELHGTNSCCAET